MKNQVLIIILLTISHQTRAQGHLFANVKFNRSSIYVGQPVEVSVSVFTSTWFTKGVNPGNIKVNGAFTVYFRSVSQSTQINGKTYAGVEMIYHVIPYDDENLIFPSVEFNVETPNAGDYKGVKRIVRTKERTIKVKPVPEGFDKNEWIVTSNMSVIDNWSGNKTSVKVGDVIERRITRNVSSTVSELIPPVIWDSISGVSLYPSKSAVSNNKSKLAISATRTDGVRYLFEKEGNVVIPEMVFSWWNPARKKIYKRTLKGFTIKVLPNPDLGMLETMRDSLAISSESLDESDKGKSALTIFGFTIKQFLIGLFVVLAFLYVMIKSSIWLYRIISLRKEQYQNSEFFYFKQVKRAIKSKKSAEISETLYQWIDQINLSEPTIRYFAEKYGTESLKKEITIIDTAINNNTISAMDLHIKPWSIARNKYLREQNTVEKKDRFTWINPI